LPDIDPDEEFKE
jgi:hypothetical protein